MNIVDEKFDVQSNEAVEKIKSMGMEYESLGRLVEVLSTADSLSVRARIALNQVIDDWSEEE